MKRMVMMLVLVALTVGACTTRPADEGRILLYTDQEQGLTVGVQCAMLSGNFDRNNCNITLQKFVEFELGGVDK